VAYGETECCFFEEPVSVALDVAFWVVFAFLVTATAGCRLEEYFLSELPESCRFSTSDRFGNLLMSSAMPGFCKATFNFSATEEADLSDASEESLDERFLFIGSGKTSAWTAIYFSLVLSCRWRRVSVLVFVYGLVSAVMASRFEKWLCEKSSSLEDC